MENYYFDHAASTPLAPEVLAAMMDVYSNEVGNASSTHRFGRAMKQRLHAARDTIASYIGCRANELIFTSGGTESNQLALLGLARAQKVQGRNHLITTAIEHHAVLKTCEALQAEGFELTVVPVNEDGIVTVDEIAAAIRPTTALISVMYVNNEIGTVQPIEQIGQLAREHHILFHVDAVQALGKLRLNMRQLPVDAMSFSAHKINGPQGVGGLYVAAKTKIFPVQYGGSQERNRRAGTENIAGVVGFAKAVALAYDYFDENSELYAQLALRWVEQMQRIFGADNIIVHGHSTQRVAHIVNISFVGYSTETLLMNFDLQGIAASGGSACSAGSLEPSHVLQAMNVEERYLRSAIRFSFGAKNNLEQLQKAASKIETFFNLVRKS